MERIAREILSPDERDYLLKRIDIIGDIAIIKIHPFLEHKRFEIANYLLKIMSNIKVVYRQVTPTRGAYRIKGLEWLGGEKRSWTIVKEYGCPLFVDIKKVFYTPRLSFEHMRIAKMVAPNEVILNMFAGIGSFSIMIAKYARPKRIYSIDINPYAYKLMIKNIRLNRVENVVVPILGDAAEIILHHRLINLCDRILMPLPFLALKYLPFALLSLKPEGGYIHLYLNVFVPRGVKACHRAIKLCDLAFKSLNLDYEITSCRKVRSVGPRLLQVVLDVHIRKGFYFDLD